MPGVTTYLASYISHSSRASFWRTWCLLSQSKPPVLQHMLRPRDLPSSSSQIVETVQLCQRRCPNHFGHQHTHQVIHMSHTRNCQRRVIRQARNRHRCSEAQFGHRLLQFRLPCSRCISIPIHGLVKFSHHVPPSLTMDLRRAARCRCSSKFLWRKAFCWCPTAVRYDHKGLFPTTRACGQQVQRSNRWRGWSTQVVASLSMGKFLSHKLAPHSRHLLRTLVHIHLLALNAHRWICLPGENVTPVTLGVTSAEQQKTLKTAQKPNAKFKSIPQ